MRNIIYYRLSISPFVLLRIQYISYLTVHFDLIRTKCTSTVIRTKEYCVIIYYTYVLAALLIAYFKSYLNMASEFFQFSTTLIDTGLHNIINQNRILLYPSFLGIDRGNLNLMVANYFIGTSFKYNKTSR